MPQISNKCFSSGSKLFKSKPVFGSQPTCPMCWKLLGVPISAFVNFFFLFFPFFFSLVYIMLLGCELTFLMCISGFLISTVAIGKEGPLGASRLFSDFLCRLPTSSDNADRNFFASSSLAKLSPIW